MSGAHVENGTETSRVSHRFLTKPHLIEKTVGFV